MSGQPAGPLRPLSHPCPPDCDCSAADPGQCLPEGPAGGATACANPTSRAPTVSSAPLASTAQAASVESSPGPGSIRRAQEPGPSVTPPCSLPAAPAPAWWTEPVTVTPGQCMCRTGFEGAACIPAVPLATSTSPCQWMPCTPSGQAGVGLGLGLPAQGPLHSPSAVCGQARGTSPRVVTPLAAACAGQSSTAPTVTAAPGLPWLSRVPRWSGWLWWGSGQGEGHRRRLRA